MAVSFKRSVAVVILPENAHEEVLQTLPPGTQYAIGEVAIELLARDGFAAETMTRKLTRMVVRQWRVANGFREDGERT